MSINSIAGLWKEWQKILKKLAAPKGLLPTVLWNLIAVMQIRIRLITLMRTRILILFYSDPDADPDPTFYPDANPDPVPSFQNKGSYSVHFGLSFAYWLGFGSSFTLMRIRFLILFDADF